MYLFFGADQDFNSDPTAKESFSSFENFTVSLYPDTGETLMNHTLFKDDFNKNNMYENDAKAKTICCAARTAKCMACTRGINIASFCALEPQTPGCSSPVDPIRESTVEQYLVDVILRVHPPSHSLGIFEGSTDVPKELQTSMQASMSVLNYADPDMGVRSVTVESASDGKEKVPLVHVTISTSSHENAVQLSKILSHVE